MADPWNCLCQACGIFYRVPQYRISKSRYCSKVCHSSAVAKKYLNTGPKPWAAKNLDGHRHKSTSRFPVGHKPWNKDLRGIHLSPDTEFKAGRDSEQKLPDGKITIRVDKAGRLRAWLKVSGEWLMRARVVYAAKHGEIPSGMVVHHIDRNTLNDRPDNLAAMTRAEHINEHRQDVLGGRNA